MAFTLKTGFKKIRTILVLVFFSGIAFALTNCANAPDLPYYQKSPQSNAFDYQGDKPFAQYLTDTRAYLKENRVFFDAAKQDQELEMIAPFEWQPASSCPAANKRGILMIHGLSGTAFVMRDLATALDELD